MTNHNPASLKMIRNFGQTPGFMMEAESDGRFKLARLAMPEHGVELATVKISSRVKPRQYENDITRLRHIGWTQTLYERCQEISRQHRIAGTDPAEDHLKALLGELTVPAPRSGQEATKDGRKPVRRHSGGGTATGSAKMHAGTAQALQTPPLPEPAPVQVLETAARIQAELITPMRALELLVNLAPYQRRLKDPKVEEYAAAMRRGEWDLLPSDPICIDTNGQTANGQHRLQAVVECELPQKFYVAYDVDPAAYAKMDRGAKRTTADMLYGANEVSPTALASVAKLAFLWFNVEQEHWKTTPPVSETQVFAMLEAHPDLRESVRLGRLSGGLKVSPTGSMLAHYLITRKLGGDNRLVTRWYQAMAGVELEKGQPGHSLALYFLRNSPSAARRTTLSERPRRDLDVYLLIQAWNNTCLGKEVRAISWKNDFTIAQPIAPTDQHGFPPFD